MTLQVKLFGTFEASLNGQPAAGLRTDKVRALLAYLLIEAQRAHPREALAELLWPDQSLEAALHNLRQALSTLRKALGDDSTSPPFLLLQQDTLQWNPAAAAQVDVHEFQRLAAMPNPAARVSIRRLQRAFDLYRAPFLQHFTLPDSSPWEEWAMLTREVINQQALNAFNRLMEIYERRQEYDQAAQLAARLLKLAPWDETLHAAAMRLHALQGNPSAALAQYTACRRYLRSELDVDPAPATTALFESIRKGAPPAPRFAPARHNLPQPATPFSGRAAELDELAERLADPSCRLITLLGPGGIGKTRLALQAAREQVGVFSDGVFFIPLGGLNDCARLPAAIAEPLGIQLLPQEEPHAQLHSALASRHCLLVLDSMEELADGALCLSDLLQAAPGLVILATTRMRLNLQEEWLVTVEGLPVPPEGAWALPELLQYPAVELFLRAARRMGSTALPSPEEGEALAGICRLVDGTPLSLELAASASRVRSLPEIAAELARSMDILSNELLNVPQRHRSLRATFEHTFNLLTDSEQRAFARLGIFNGLFDLPAARAVCGSDPFGLVESFLVKRDEAGRFWLHNTLRQFAREKLQLAPQEEQQTARLHAEYYAQFLRGHESALESIREESILQEIGHYADEFIQAWRYALGGQRTDLLEQSLNPLFIFFDLRSRYQDAIQLFKEAAALLPEGQPLRARILTRVGILYNRVGRHEEALQAVNAAWQQLKDTPLLNEQVYCLTWLANLTRQSKHQSEARALAGQALALARENHLQRSVSSALYILSYTESNAGNYQAARQHLEESLAIARQLNIPRSIMTSLNALADVDCYTGDYPRAVEIYSECLEISRQLGDRYNQAMHLNNLGTVAYYLEQYQQAGQLYQDSLVICQEIGDMNGVSVALSNLGELTYLAGDWRRAEQFFQRGLDMARRINDTWSILASLNNLGMVCTAQGRLDTARQLLLEGLALSLQNELLPRQLQSLLFIAEWLEKSQRPVPACQVARVVLADPALEDGLRSQAQAVLERCGTLASDPLPSTAEMVARILSGETL